MKKMKVALIGCGMISEVYLKNLKSFDAIELVGCSDIIRERAEKRAKEFGIKAMTNEEIFADKEIQFVVNTTYPLAHYEIIKSCLENGKHVYTEKMTTETVEQATEVLKLAQSKGLFAGGAPDSFLGGGCQLARQIIDSGLIGTPVAVDAMLSRSYHHERFYTGDYKRFAFCRNGGIIFDMGAYYLTHMIFLLGNIKQVSGFAQIIDPNRKYENPKCPLFGQDMTVESYNNITGSLLFESGVLGHLTVTSEGGGTYNRFNIYGTNGRIDLGDPNNFEGSIKLYNKNGAESVIHTSHGFTGGNLRGIGALDAVYAIKNGRAPRCSVELNRHVLEAALGICSGTTYNMTTYCDRPKPLKAGYTEYSELVFEK